MFDANGNPVVSRNPVLALKECRAWFGKAKQNSYIPERKLPAWYRAVTALKDEAARFETLSCYRLRQLLGRTLPV